MSNAGKSLATERSFLLFLSSNFNNTMMKDKKGEVEKQ